MTGAHDAQQDGAALSWQGESTSPEHTRAIGGAVAHLARAGDVIALEGDLGAGKTQFTVGLAVGMGIEPRDVASPTFVFMHEYESAASELVLVHMDAYRLTDERELETVGWDPATRGEEIRDGAITVIEWADRLGSGFATDALRVQLEHLGDERRRISISAGLDWRSRFAELAAQLNRTGSS